MDSQNSRPTPKTMLALLLLAAVTVSIAFAGDRNYPTAPASFTVGTNSMMIVAPRLVSARSWVAGTVYEQGDMVRSTAHTSRVYWNVTTNAGAATTCPDHLSVMTDVTDGDITWRRIVPRARQGIIVQLSTENECWFSIGSAAVVSNGWKLIENGSFSIATESLQDAVYAIGISNDTHVTTQEF